MMMFLLLTKIIFILLASLISLPFGNSKEQSGCFKSIISLGDSLADTGNLALLSSTDLPPSALPPYGRTFFHHPTGRYSDGRLVIDFVADALGLPYVQPYIGGRNGNVSGTKFENGVNFAVAGATALDTSSLEKRGIFNVETNVSLGIEMQWFRQFLATLPDGRRYLEGSLIIAGEIGGNDYNHALVSGGKNIKYIKSLVPEVVNYIGLIINELISLGARTLLVPGITPMGCMPVYLTRFTSKNARDYNHKTGCLNSMNEFAQYHNEFLQRELNVLQELHPDVAIIYADYYNALIPLHVAPQDFGFTSGALKACCGAGGPYNYNRSVPCGFPSTTCCDDPSSFVSWDGIHLTEATYRFVAKGLLEGPFTVPQIKTVCQALGTLGDNESFEY